MVRVAIKLRSCLVGVAAVGLSLGMVIGCFRDAPELAAGYGLGPIVGFYVHRNCGGRGIVGGAAGGVAAGLMLVIYVYLIKTPKPTYEEYDPIFYAMYFVNGGIMGLMLGSFGLAIDRLLSALGRGKRA